MDSKRFYVLILLICSLAFTGIYTPALWAVDYGVLVKGEFDVAAADETDPTGSVIAAPWVSVPLTRLN